jgi:hypothetical protein
MNWKELLTRQTEQAYKVVTHLVGLCNDGELNWKPDEENNWMTTAQLLYHTANSGGKPMNGFASGSWTSHEHVDGDMEKSKKMMPPATSMPGVSSIAEALQLLEADKSLALETIANVSEEDLATKPSPAPWDPKPVILGIRLLEMVEHLNQHKAQLFYYLKLQNKSVGTFDLYGV